MRAIHFSWIQGELLSSHHRRWAGFVQRSGRQYSRYERRWPIALRKGVSMVKTWMLVVLFCAAPLPGYAQQNSESDVEAKIVAMERVWAQAYISKDPQALERILY